MFLLNLADFFLSLHQSPWLYFTWTCSLLSSYPWGGKWNQTHCFWLRKHFSLPPPAHLSINNPVLPHRKDSVFEKENRKEKNQCIWGSKQQNPLPTNQTEGKQSKGSVSSLEPNLRPSAAAGVCRRLRVFTPPVSVASVWDYFSFWYISMAK